MLDFLRIDYLFLIAIRGEGVSKHMLPTEPDSGFLACANRLIVQCFILFDVHVLMLNAAETKYLAKEGLFC